MRVAFVANSCWNIYNFRKGLVHYFLNHGHEVLVFSPRDEYVELVEKWGCRHIETPLNATGKNPFKDLFFFKTLYAAIRRKKPHIMLSYTIKSNIYSCLVSRLLKIPIICNVSGLGTVFLVKGFMKKIAINLCRASFRYASFVFFQNRDDKDLFLSRIRLPEERVGVISGSGIDLKEFSVQDYSPTDNFHFLMISRLILEKGVREFAEAASRFTEDEKIKFTLVGRLDKMHARSIRKVELEHWVTNNWLDYQPHTNQVKKLIASCDAIILPSHREGTPRTLLEGAAIGRALIASKVPGCTEVVKEGENGFLFEVKNTNDLVQKIESYMKLSNEERSVMSQKSRALVESRFDEKRIIDVYKMVIDRIKN